MSLRCAIYARYSSDHQSPASIQDQVRKCREYAAQQRWIVLEGEIYADAERSGAGADRPGLQSLLQVTQRKPRVFDVLLVDDTSRLSRRLADQSSIVDQLRFSGFRFVAVSQGIDSTHEQSDVLLTVHGLVDSLYLKEVGKKTHRGLQGKALNGMHTGGRCFGYRSEPGPDGTRLVIEEIEAAVVRRIFELSASGMSLKRIAKMLNDERIPSPRPRKGKLRATWCPTALRAMLRNELYTGKLIWNRSYFVKRPGTNKRVSRPRPRSEWTIVERPELRIVGDDLWRRVEERQERLIAVYGKATRGVHRASSSPFLLTGILKCGSCGGNLIIVGGKGKNAVRKHYGCGQHFYRGACSNGLRIEQLVLERNFFAQLQAKVLTDDVLNYTIQEFTRRLRERPDQESEVSVMQNRRQEIEQELSRLAAAIAETGASRFLVEAVRERERELAVLEAKLAAEGRAKIARHPGDVRQFVKASLTDLLSLLKVDVIRARTELMKFTREIRMVPENDENGQRFYTAEGTWNLLGEGNFANVAGVGFEPTTFGL